MEENIKNIINEYSDALIKYNESEGEHYLDTSVLYNMLMLAYTNWKLIIYERIKRIHK